MAIVLAVIGYGTFLYGHEATGCVILGLAIGALWAEERRRLTNPPADPEDGHARRVHSSPGEQVSNEAN